MTAIFRDELGSYMVEGVESLAYCEGKWSVLFEDDTKQKYNAQLVGVMKD